LRDATINRSSIPSLREGPPALPGKEFFSNLMSLPFHHGLVIVFLAAALMSLIGAAASWAAGGKFVHHEASGEALGRE
jgi:hypothetical protein